MRSPGAPPRLCAAWLMAALLLPARMMAAEGPAPADFSRVVTPFLREHCISCHGPEKQKGKLRLDTLPDHFSDPRASAQWKEVVRALNAREMPPEEEPQPPVERSGAVADWLAAELGRAEVAARSTRVVLRRMNRSEYNHTIRDLLGVDFQPADAFPEDPPAGGFDNIGQALTLSPLQLELYYSAALQVLDRVLVEGERPAGIRWHFEPEEDVWKGVDRTRVKRDDQNLLLNRGENPVERGFTLIHHEAWNKGINFRGFKVPVAGDYVLRFRAAGRVPARAEVVRAAQGFVARQREQEDAQNPQGREYHRQAMEERLKHFRTAGTYDYGPPRIKIVQTLGGMPRTVAEMDVDAPESAPRVYEVPVYFSTQEAGVSCDQAYEVTRSLENWTLLEKDAFPRPALLVDWLELAGPILPSWPPPAHRRLLFDSPRSGSDERGYAREVLERFMTKAYRRPLLEGEVESKLALYDRVRAGKPSFVAAIRVPLAAVLASPHFLYLVEPAPGEPRRLGAFEVASRLSYFLWSSMPDDELFRLAGEGRLLEPAVLREQVVRMIADPKSEAFVENFAGQWLGLRKVGANPPVKNLYPDYDRHFELSIVRETEGFFAEILRQDLDVRNLIRSDFVTINERLARFYGIPGVKGDAIRRVAVPAGVHRGGLVTQASIQTITSNGTRTSPVVRGVWVLRTLLGADPGLPVANVGEIASQVPGIDKATVRRRLEIHREAASCARCHDKIDPLGLALENYDACGRWRVQEGHGYEGRIEADDPAIDASAQMPDGAAFVGVEGLQAQLLKDQEPFLQALASQLFTYALGRELGFSDRPAVRAAVTAMKERDYRLRELLVALVQSDLFLTK